MRHRLDTDGKAYDIGLKAENSFEELMKSKGWQVVKANAYQNMKEHWDFKISKPEVEFTVDVKAKKRVSRADDSTQSELIWIELKNGKGNAGWLYGKADYIAFQIDNGYFFIERPLLASFVEKKTSEGKDVKTSKEALYNRYSRSGREDLLTMIKYSDIKGLGYENI